MCEGFTDIEYKYCKQITDKLYHHPLALLFLKPVDPITDGCPDYFDVIKEPMDLRTVKEKLNGCKYESSFQWRNDVMKIWENSIKYNAKHILIKKITEKLKKISIKMMTNIPKTDVDLWYIQLQDASKELQSFLKYNPSSSSGMSRSKSKSLHSNPYK
ncbi:Bromodomain containing protein [Tritrichomonas foetus]|uniref:Bromodomain containing protein n=1 Tax=Tritrichomonas foetus TaxID=1144522 RepID=A0A1J4KMM7_9EUKA|nr:Bromodomain containing protein [Tritrichomonas foetus]|eukprot:OHT12483.1 Bromodomain containing protein [Tritrichomonas foetus]